MMIFASIMGDMIQDIDQSKTMMIKLSELTIIRIFHCSQLKFN